MVRDGLAYSLPVLIVAILGPRRLPRAPSLIVARGLSFMLRPRKEPDPLSGKRRLLAEQERLLAERMANQLNRRLANNGEEETGPPKPVEPPVWRLEEDAPRVRRTSEPAAVNRGASASATCSSFSS